MGSLIFQRYLFLPSDIFEGIRPCQNQSCTGNAVRFAPGGSNIVPQWNTFFCRDQSCLIFFQGGFYQRWQPLLFIPSAPCCGCSIPEIIMIFPWSWKARQMTKIVNTWWNVKEQTTKKNIFSLTFRILTAWILSENRVPPNFIKFHGLSSFP
jgi:hypothetical protein